MSDEDEDEETVEINNGCKGCRSWVELYKQLSKGYASLFMQTLVQAEEIKDLKEELEIALRNSNPHD